MKLRRVGAVWVSRAVAAACGMLTLIGNGDQPALSAEAPAVRPYRGLREELRSADAVLRVSVTAERAVDAAPGSTGRAELQVVVKKVLGGSLARPGDTLTLSYLGAEHEERSRRLPPKFAFAPHSDTIVLVEGERGRLQLLTAIHPDDTLRTDELLAHYHALARGDDRTFALGLARLLTAIVCSDPDRLAWVGWIPIVFDDWNRISQPPPTDEAGFRTMVADAHRMVVSQIHAVADGRDDVWPNLHDLPWLIRFLTEGERRDLARALLSVHVIAQRELDAATKALPQTPPDPTLPEPELSMDQVQAMAAHVGMSYVINCLALCLDPRMQGLPPPDTLDRARAFAARGGR